MAYVNMAHMPDPKTEYTVNFFELNGGINLSELEYRLSNRESPEMKNLMWREGVLCCRDGQEWMVEDDSLGVGYAMYERLFSGFLVAHIGTKLYYLDPSPRMNLEHDSYVYHELCEGVPEIRGSFFTYYDKLYYKTVGKYICVTYDPVLAELSATEVVGYTPIIQINTDPETGAGDLYQPENRIQAKKTLWYNAKSEITDYYLPVQNIDEISCVTVGGVILEATDYDVDTVCGKITFHTAPPVTVPPTNNTVAITYVKENPDAFNSVMDCPYAATYGGTGDLCVVLGGCPVQPNAFFWNGNNIAMDATYFPISQYQLAGDTDDPIMGFGKQQSYLVVFKRRSIGRAKMSTTDMNGRTVIDMPYVSINDKIGCDLPWTIQLIDNNLVWCNTEQGVHLLKDSSYAYENNIECFSIKVNRSLTGTGLLSDIRQAEVVCSQDDGKRYWLCANGHVWLWDYENTDYHKPSWYYFTDIAAVAFSAEIEQDSAWHLDAKGRLTKFTRYFRDYGDAIDKSFRFPVQYFGGYDRLKNVNSVIIVLRPDTQCTAILKYISDYETRRDRTDLSHISWSLVSRDLSFRSLRGIGFGAVFRRRPMCRRVKHFTMQLENNVAGQDLAIVSAQVFYNYQGRFR